MSTLLTLIHGESGVGKSTFGNTGPTPRLILDAEGKSKYLKGKKVYWDPMIDEPPDAPLVVVDVSDWTILQAVYQQLSVKNPFRSVVFDSLTIAQKRLIRHLYGTEKLDWDNYGEIQRIIESLIESFYRKLGLDTLTLLTGSHEEKRAVRPFLVGKVMNSLAYYVDVVGYMYAERKDGEITRSMLVQPVDGYVAADNIGIFGTVLQDPNLTDMHQLLTKHMEQLEEEQAS
jgi:hypothetical protein